MNKLLAQTLEVLEKESGDFDQSFVLVDQLIEKYGEAGLTNRLNQEMS